MSTHTYANEVKLFHKWTYDDIEVSDDISLEVILPCISHPAQEQPARDGVPGGVLGCGVLVEVEATGQTYGSSHICGCTNLLLGALGAAGRLDVGPVWRAMGAKIWGGACGACVSPRILYSYCESCASCSIAMLFECTSLLPFVWLRCLDGSPRPSEGEA
jgi:hypothetical protein